MIKTHHEMLKTIPFMDEVFKVLSKELPEPGFSYKDFMGVPFIKDMLLSLSQQCGSKDALSNFMLMFHIHSLYVGSGRNYELHENMAEMLLNTKLDIDTALVKSPFQEIYVTLPPVLQIYVDGTGFHDISSMYLNLYESNNTKELRILCVGHPNSKSVNELDDAIFYFFVNLLTGKVSESLKTQLDKWNNEYERDVFSTDHDMEMMPRIYQLSLNILLYLTSHDSDVRYQKSIYGDMDKKLQGLSSSTKIRKLEKKMSRVSKFGKYIIGGNTVLSQEESDLYKAVRENGKHHIRYPVGGHWRMQWYGSKDSQIQKPKWIRPHFRGPEIAELIKNIGVIK